ncbi:class III signal peptide-containing protein [Thermococcus sp.]|uniref:class III signal peptide-containing protein n=1 Tax=Thermococcus sp. TaxID=35749 RepID=UPI002639B2B6|nr:class III signal peptide-containing protein [Thermococcus sp.]
MRRAQTAIEYLFMLAAVLVLVLIAARTIFQSMQTINNSINKYINQTRAQLLENL